MLTNKRVKSSGCRIRCDTSLHEFTEMQVHAGSAPKARKGLACIAHKSLEICERCRLRWSVAQTPGPSHNATRALKELKRAIAGFFGRVVSAYSLPLLLH